jgi:phosphoenolpyruvate carboxykinase (ATP)
MDINVGERISSEGLLEQVLQDGVSDVTTSGAIVVQSGERIDASPKDRFFVKDAVTADKIDWNAWNQEISSENFQLMWEDALAVLDSHLCYAAQYHVGSDREYYQPILVNTTSARHQLFARYFFIAVSQRSFNPQEKPSWSILHAPYLKVNPRQYDVHSEGVVAIDIVARRILIVGLQYAGELKNAMYSVMSFLLPDVDVLPMRCAANQDDEGRVALFFGLEAGQTIVSLDPERALLGDHAHGWSPSGVFNFEGGCYSRCRGLSPEQEPLVYQAANRVGALMENVVMKEGEPDFSDTSITTNARVAYPRYFLANRVPENQVGHPSAVILLCCDVYGVLPMISQLTLEQALYFYLSGYTAEFSSAKEGSKEQIRPVFSQGYAESCSLRPVETYLSLFQKRLEETHSPVYLLNTGWQGGSHDQGGKRMDVRSVQKILTAILSLEGKIGREQSVLPIFNLAIPDVLSGVEGKMLDPRFSWASHAHYYAQLQRLAGVFLENSRQYDLPLAVERAGPAVEGFASAVAAAQNNNKEDI